MGEPGADPTDQPEGGRGGQERRPGELTRLFLRLGVTTLAGPAAHITTMPDEVVRRRG